MNLALLAAAGVLVDRFVMLAVAGIFLDVVWTFLVFAIDRCWPWRAALAQFVFTLVAIGATVAVVETRSVSDLIAYGLGGALGTYLVVKWTAKTRS